MKKLFLSLLTGGLFLSACNAPKDQSSTSQATIDSLKALIALDHSTETAAIEKLDQEWNAASMAHSADGWLGFYSDDAIVMPPNETMHSDKAAVEKSIKDMFAVPGMELKWQNKKVEVSKSGDMAYSLGNYQWKSKDAKGKDYNETGKYTEIWKKQPDGTWKCVADIWNADPLAK
jgi:ketosteroid isomerase-like protein